MKKTIALLISLFMLFSLVACEEVEDSKTDAPGDEDKSLREIVEVEGGFKIPKIELTNKTVHFYGLDQPQFYEGDEGIARKFFEEFYGGELVYEMVSAADLYTNLSALVLSGDSPDLATAHLGFPGLALTEVIQPVDDIPDFNLEIMQNLEHLYRQYEVEGRHYWLPWVAPIAQYIFYNTRIFENNDLESPKSLYQKGQWDWNKFLEYAQELTVDETGDGNPDVWGVSMCVWHDARFMQTTGEILLKTDEDGKLVSNLGSPNLQRAANFLADMTLQHRVADPNRDPNHVMSTFNVGNSAMLLGPFFWQGTDAAFPAIKESRILGTVPLPKDPQTDEHYVEAQGIGFYVPTGAKNKQGAEAFLYSAIVSLAQESIPGSENFENAKKNFLEKWGEFGYTEEDYINNQEYLNSFQDDLTLVTNPYPDLLEISHFYEMMIGAHGQPPMTYEQVRAELEPDLMGLVEDIYNTE